MFSNYYNLAQATAGQLPPLPPGPSLEQIRVPDTLPPSGLSWGVLIGLGILIIALFFARNWLLAGCQWLRNRRAIPTPLQEARAELNANNLNQDASRFAAGLSNCLRRYIQNAYTVGHWGQSQQEWVDSMRESLAMEAAALEPLDQLLKRCENIKFSQASLTEAERESLTQTARALLVELDAHKQEETV